MRGGRRAARGDAEGGPPAPRFHDPMLASPLPPGPPDVGWVHERKLDGERIVAVRDGDTVRLWTRNRKDATGTYPEVVAALVRQPVDRFVIDGEVVAFDKDGNTSFSLLQRRMHRSDRFAQRGTGVEAHYLVFDCLHIGDEDLRPLPLVRRKRILEGTFDYGTTLRFVPHRTGRGYDAYPAACRAGWEGLVAKRADAAYEEGRSRAWRKIKCVRSGTFEIVGWTRPRGGRTGIGALLLAEPTEQGLRYVGKVGTGLDEAMLETLARALHARHRRSSPLTVGPDPDFEGGWAEPGFACEVAYTERTPEGRLRHPVFKGLRRDKAKDTMPGAGPSGPPASPTGVEPR